MKKTKLYMYILGISFSVCSIKMAMAENINNIFNNPNQQNSQPILQNIPQVNPDSNNGGQANTSNPIPVVNSTNQVPAMVNNQPPIVGNPVPVTNNTVAINNPSNNLNNAINLDNSQKTINDIKRQTALLEAQKALAAAKGGAINGNPATSQPPIATTDHATEASISTDNVVTATMKNYIAFKNGKKIATILFGNGATTEVEIGSILYNYKVIKINEEGVTLRPLKKGKEIVLQRNLPVNQNQNQGQGFNYQLVAPSYNTIINQN